MNKTRKILVTASIFLLSLTPALARGGGGGGFGGGGFSGGGFGGAGSAPAGGFGGGSAHSGGPVGAPSAGPPGTGAGSNIRPLGGGGGHPFSGRGRGLGYGLGFGYGGYGYGGYGYGDGYDNNQSYMSTSGSQADDQLLSDQVWQRKQTKRLQSLPTGAFVKNYQWSAPRRSLASKPKVGNRSNSVTSPGPSTRPSLTTKPI